MVLRCARHCNDLAAMMTFYCDVLGLEKLGEFRNHGGYDGIMIGKKGENWHLEFTSSPIQPVHTPDPDDLIVLYFESQNNMDDTIRRAAAAAIYPVVSRNPYWNEQGIMLRDPEGYFVILTRKQG